MKLANVVAARDVRGHHALRAVRGRRLRRRLLGPRSRAATERGAPTRALIEESIGPVWEANHVWLIFVLVTLWTGFPSAFAPIMSTLYVPLTLAAVGIILRGSAFAFRKASRTIEPAPAVRRRVRVVVGDHAVLPRIGGGRRRVGPGARGNAGPATCSRAGGIPPRCSAA